MLPSCLFISIAVIALHCTWDQNEHRSMLHVDLLAKSVHKTCLVTAFSGKPALNDTSCSAFHRVWQQYALTPFLRVLA